MTPSKKLTEKAIRKGFASVEEYKAFLDKKSAENCQLNNKKYALEFARRRLEHYKAMIRFCKYDIERYEKEIAELENS